MRHETIEKSLNLMMVLIVVAISIGGLVEIVPLMMSSDATEPDEGIEVYSPLRLAGRDVYVREGCYNCHSQMIRPFRSETERYGPFTTAGETVYDRPFQFGSKRTGPDLARVGGRYSDDWQRLHLMDPRALVPESNMPAYPWLADNEVDGDLITAKAGRFADAGRSVYGRADRGSGGCGCRQDRARRRRRLFAGPRHQSAESQVKRHGYQ